MRPCFVFTAKTATKPAVLSINDEIGLWGVQPGEFRDQLAAIDGDLFVEVNTPGGDVFAGLAMYNMLRDHAAKGHKISTRNMGVAASMGSVLMLAGDVREAHKNTMVMTHNVKSGVWGTEDEIRDHADTVGKIRSQLRAIYQDRLGLDEAAADALMGKDTWMTAEEAQEVGFVTAVLDEVKIAAKFDVERAALPEHVAKLFAATAEEEPAPAPEPEITKEDQEQLQTPVAEAVVALAKASGLEAHASFLALSCANLDEAKARLTEAREIVALCTVAGHSDKAAAHIRAKASVADVRAALVAAMAASDEHIDATQGDKQSGKTGDESASPPVVNTASIWASHNKQLKKGA